MKAAEVLRKMLLPPGPILSLLLIGLMLLGGLLYNRAVRFQRFLEPTLAITQPRVRFDNEVAKLLFEELGQKGSANAKYFSGTVRIREAVIFGREHGTEAMQVLRALSRFFLRVLDDPGLRGDIKVILVSMKAPIGQSASDNKKARHDAQEKAGGILDALFTIEPELESRYAPFFEASAMSVARDDPRAGWIDFRIFRSEERLHIDVLDKLQKYAR